MNKLKAILLVLIIIAIVGGISLYRSQIHSLVKPTPEISPQSQEHFKTSSEKVVMENKAVLNPEVTDFQDSLDQKFKTLATVDDLQQLTEEDVHYTPEVIKDAGGVIGQIHDEAEQDPAKRVPVMHFFKKCAEDPDLVPAIRAVCLNKIYTLIPTWKIPVPISDELISSEVSDLASKLR